VTYKPLSDNRLVTNYDTWECNGQIADGYRRYILGFDNTDMSTAYLAEVFDEPTWRLLEQVPLLLEQCRRANRLAAAANRIHRGSRIMCDDTCGCDECTFDSALAAYLGDKHSPESTHLSGTRNVEEDAT
jgi:hypothetical protein